MNNNNNNNNSNNNNNNNDYGNDNIIENIFVIDAYIFLVDTNKGFNIFSEPRIPIALYLYRGFENTKKDFIIEYEFTRGEKKERCFIEKKSDKNNKRKEDSYKVYEYKYITKEHRDMLLSLETKEEKRYRIEFKKRCFKDWTTN